MDGISVITPTCKIECIDNLIRNYSLQKFKNKELIVVINNDNIPVDLINKYRRYVHGIKVFVVSQQESLGACLNFAVEKCKYSYIAKFDDDDYYGPSYLDEVAMAFNNQQCDVVGKIEIFYYFIDQKKLIKQTRNMENSFVHRVAGATLSFRKEIYEQIKFKDINRSEDTNFISECKKHNLKIYSTSRNNYMAIRYDELSRHSWVVTSQQLINSKSSYQLVGEQMLIDDAERYVRGDKSIEKKDINDLNGITMITPTIKPQCVENIISNYHRQRIKNKELIIVINCNDIEIADFNPYIKSSDDIKIFKRPELSQGACLNYAVSQGKYGYIAKIDDDDYYGPLYLQEVGEAFQKMKCEVVGKYEPYYFFVDKGILIEQNKHSENMYVSRVAGATLCFKKELFNHIEFKDQDSAIDIEFLSKCREQNYKIFSTSKKNYAVMRYNDASKHTWQISIQELLRCTSYQVVLSNPSISEFLAKVDEKTESHNQ